jgi:hypothetical protein
MDRNKPEKFQNRLLRKIAGDEENKRRMVKTA